MLQQRDRSGAAGADGRGAKRPWAVPAILGLCLALAAVLLAVILPKQSVARAGKLLAAGDYEAGWDLLKGRGDPESTALRAEYLFQAQKSRLGRPAVGSTVFFGSWEQDDELSDGPEEIEWLVLAVDGDKALLISRYGLDARDFNDENNMYSVVTWSNSQLRSWLNDAFYAAAFSPVHQEMILLTEVSADRNPDSEVRPGKATKDRVFLLSIDEARRYFDSDGDRRCSGTAYCRARGAAEGPDGGCWWWLRTPGVEESCPSVVLPDGEVFTNGFSSAHSPTLAVRPAMWIDLTGVGGVGSR